MSTELNKGIAIIIDDKLYNEEDLIFRISKIISEKGIPYCGFSKLKDAMSCVDNFLAINFLVLDWRLNIPEGIPLTDGIKKSNAVQNIKFIQEFKKKCFAPIFIFSAEAEDDILDELEKYGGGDLINKDASRNFILIKGKSDLIEGNNLFDSVESWINNNPAIYTLKMWENSFMNAKNNTFWHLFNRSPMWPKILWDTYAKDSVDENLNLMELVNKNISSRTKLMEHDEKVLEQYQGEISKDEIREVIQGIMIAGKEVLSDKDLQPGDIFKISGDYYLNLRPICDTVIGRMGADGAPTAACDGDFYAIRGSKLTAKGISDRYDEDLEMLNERSNEAIVYGIDGKDFVQFVFKKMYIYSYSDKKASRIGRLLSPYINHVQQRYSSYIGRFGLPRIPVKVIEDLLPLQTGANG